MSDGVNLAGLNPFLPFLWPIQRDPAAWKKQHLNLKKKIIGRVLTLTAASAQKTEQQFASCLIF